MIKQLDFVLDRNQKKSLFYEWVIIGAETGNRKDKIIPKPEWIEELIDIDIPLFLKENMRPYWRGKWRQEFPI